MSGIYKKLVAAHLSSIGEILAHDLSSFGKVLMTENLSTGGNRLSPEWLIQFGQVFRSTQMLTIIPLKNILL